MNRFRSSACLIPFLLMAAGLFGDTLTYRSDMAGTGVLQGIVTELPAGYQVRMRGEGGEFELVLDRSVVVGVKYGTMAAPSTGPQLTVSSNPQKAIDHLLTAYRRNPASRSDLAPQFSTAVKSYLDRIAEMAGPPTYDFEGALKAYDEVRRNLDTIEGRSMLGPLRDDYVRRIESGKAKTLQAYSKYLADRAMKALGRKDTSRSVLNDLLRAREIDERNPSVWYGLALYYSALGSNDIQNNATVIWAAQKFLDLTQDDTAEMRRRRIDARELQRKARLANEKTARQGASPPGTARSGGAAPVQPSAGSGSSIFQRLKSGDWSVLSDIGSELLAGEYVALLLAIAAVVLLYWVVPAKILASRTNRGSVAASIWRPRVRYLGLFALAGYLLGSIRMPRARRGGERCPVCKKQIDNIEDYTDFNFLVCPHCGENVTPVYNLDDYIQHLVEQVSREVHRRRGQYTESSIEKDATLKLVRAMIVRGVRSRTSDIHIDVGADGAKVRSRIDGVLYDSLFLPKPIVPSVVSAIKVMADLDIAERRIPQDGKLSIWVDKADIDVRVNTSPSVHGEKVSMRLLDSRSIRVGAAELGFEGQSLAFFEQAIRRPHGLIIVTGPSGSGKSTTLYVALNAINAGDKNIITLEDPIEFELKGLNQMQVNPAANFTFATGLRSIVRQDPDVIMVGEVRDKETAEMAIEAAITGHLVMTTLHTIDTTTVFTRLSDMGINTRRYASALIMLLAQRLVRINCPECKKPYKPEQKYLVSLRLEQSAKDIVFLKGYGCLHCQQTGFYGRMGLFEVFAPDRQMRTLLEQNTSASKIREMARHKGMRNIREEGVYRVMRGLTTVEEVIRATT